MKQSSTTMGVTLGLILLVLGGLLKFEWFRHVTSEPFQLMWLSGRQLNSSLLDASESGQPILAAGWRLLQPLGHLQLIRILNVPAEQIHHRQEPANNPSSGSTR